MSSQTLFGHLALKFGAHPENLATEALNYVLGESSVARARLIRFVADFGVELPSDLTFTTQVGRRGGTVPDPFDGASIAGSGGASPNSGVPKPRSAMHIPDLVGADIAGHERLIVEAKFWAGLTDSQPVTYLRRLPPGEAGMVLVIAPGLRFPTLWSELLWRCQHAGFAVTERPESAQRRIARIGSEHHLLLVSWHAIIEAILSALIEDGEGAIARDVEQLRGLCDRMDADAFLPLHPDELAACTPQRVFQFAQLVDKVVKLAEAQGLCSTKGLNPTGGAGYYGRYLRIHDMAGFLHADVRKWYQLRMTPLWLRIKDINGTVWGSPVNSRKKLVRWEHAVPSGIIYDPVEKYWVMPLHVPTHQEEDQVLDDLLQQLREMHAALGADVTEQTVEVAASNDGVSRSDSGTETDRAVEVRT